MDLDPKTLAETYARRISRVVRVKDGDTIVATLDLGYDTEHTPELRLRGIDAPETDEGVLKRRGMTDPEEIARTIEAGEKSREFLTNFLELEMTQGVYVVTYMYKKDGFKRYLADLYTALGHSVNQLLMDNGFASPYKR